MLVVGMGDVEANDDRALRHRLQQLTSEVAELAAVNRRLREQLTVYERRAALLDSDRRRLIAAGSWARRHPTLFD